MKKNTGLMVVAAIAILLIGVLTSFLWTGSGGVPPKIILPGSGDAISGVDVEVVEQNLGTVEQVTVNRSNVLRVIAMLRRPKAYTYTAAITYYYQSASSTVHLTGAVSDGYYKATQNNENGTLKQTILTPDSIYIWSSGSVTLYKGARGDVCGDDLALMPTYEDLLALDPEQITEASYRPDGAPADIVLSFEQGDKQKVYRLSVETGLLISVEEFRGDALLYRAQLTAVSCETPDPSHFRLPNGTLVTE
ncbi:MAG: hypothetical protein EOM69_10960 [Clostridia bacterium]|nr:hypothetical protein [Clostridia bacterium]